MNNDWHGVVLAAGRGVRMKSDTPKVLHDVCGLPMVAHVGEAMRLAGADRITIVAAPAFAGDPRLLDHRGAGTTVVTQSRPFGTADALLSASEKCQAARHVLVGAGDMPLIRPETIRQLMDCHIRKQAKVTVLTATVADPSGLGRIVRDSPGGRLVQIIEEKDASLEQRQIREINTSWYCFESSWLWRSLSGVSPSPVTGELYLTDLIRIARSDQQTIAWSPVSEPEEAQGVNDRLQLAAVEAVMRRRISDKWMLEGVTLKDPSSTYIDATASLGRDTVLHPGVHLRGKTIIEEHCEIGPDTVLVDARVKNGARIVSSYVEGATIEENASIGPFSKLRPGTVISRNAYIGSYAEIKNSEVGEGVHIGHFSYIGDSALGRDVNIGAGTVTCNFDGEQKHRTSIGDGAFIGSGTMLIAPRRVGAGAATGAGSVVTHDIPDGELWAGSPARFMRKVNRPDEGSAG